MSHFADTLDPVMHWMLQLRQDRRRRQTLEQLDMELTLNPTACRWVKELGLQLYGFLVIMCTSSIPAVNC